MQVDLIEPDSSKAVSPSKSPPPQQGATPTQTPSQPLHTPQASSSTSNSHSPQGTSPKEHGNNSRAQSSSGAHASSSDIANDASSLTTRSSGSQHGMQMPSVKAQKDSNQTGAASKEVGIGKRKGSLRAEARKTSEELPDVTGRQSDHTIYDASGIRRVSTAGRRVFGSSV